MRRVALLLVALALAGCGGGGDDEGYPDEAVDNFVSSCMKQEGATRAACVCVIERLQETMPYEEFAELDAALREGGEQPDPASERKLQEAVEGCR